VSGSGPRPLDRSKPPEPGSMRPFDVPEVSPVTLSNGLSLRVAQMKQLPLVTVNVVLSGGEAVLPDPLAGLAVLTGSALEGGTGKRSGPELAEAFENIGSGLSVQTGWEATTLSMTCLADRKDEGLDLLAEALLEPSFPEEEVDRLKSQRLASIRQRRMDPGSLADDSVAHFIFADSVPYHRPLAGTRDSVEKLGSAEIRDHWAERFRPGGGGVVVVGDVDSGEVAELFLRTLGGWEGVPSSGAPFSPKPRSGEGRVVVVDRPGAVQSEIRIGQVGASRSSPHYFPLQVLNTVLGGAFTSRLMLNLREEQGFTYGIRSRFAFRGEAGPFVVSTAVATEVTAAAVGEAMAELRGLVRDGPTEEEVVQSRDFIAGVFPLRFETTGQVAARIAELLIYDLPPHFFSTYRDEIRAVSASAAREAGQAVLRPDGMVVVVVGDAAKIQRPLGDLGLGPVEVVSLD
jgi:zinc protease